MFYFLMYRNHENFRARNCIEFFSELINIKQCYFIKCTEDETLLGFSDNIFRCFLSPSLLPLFYPRAPIALDICLKRDFPRPLKVITVTVCFPQASENKGRKCTTFLVTFIAHKMG